MAPQKRKTGGNTGPRKKRTKVDYEGESIPVKAPGRAYTERGRPQRTTRAMRNANHPHFNPNYTYEFRDDPDRLPTPSPPPPLAHPGTPEQPELPNTPEAPDATQEQLPATPHAQPPATPDRPIVHPGQPGSISSPASSTRTLYLSRNDPFFGDGRFEVPASRYGGSQPGSGNQPSGSGDRSPYHSSPPIPSPNNLVPANNRSPVVSSPREPSLGDLSAALTAANFSPIVASSPARFPPVSPPAGLSPGRLSNLGDSSQAPGNNNNSGPSNHSSVGNGSPINTDRASATPELTPSEAGRETERIGRREWWFSHMEALSAPRRAGVIIRRARRIHAMPPTDSHHEQVLRDNMLGMMRESVETYVPEAQRAMVWRALDDDESGDDDESRASSDYAGSYEDRDDVERAQDSQEDQQEEDEDEEMIDPDKQRDEFSNGDDDPDNSHGALIQLDTILNGVRGLSDVGRDSIHAILDLPRGQERFNALVDRVRTLRRLPSFPCDRWLDGDPSLPELEALRSIIPGILPGSLAAEALEVFNEEVNPRPEAVDYHFGNLVRLRLMQEDINPVVLTDRDIQLNEMDIIRYMLSRPRVEDREREILQRAREVRGRFMRQQELRGRFPDAALNEEWHRWILEWRVWNDDVSTLSPESDLWFRVDRILVGADPQDSRIIADLRYLEAVDILVQLEQILPDYAFPDDRIPDRMATQFERIIVARTADARARMLINRAFQVRRTEVPPRDDPRGLEMALLRRMAGWLLPPRLMEVVMPVLRGEVEEPDAPDLTSLSDDEAPVARPSWAPENVQEQEAELEDYVSDPEPELEQLASQPQAVQNQPNAATVTSTATTSTNSRLTSRDPAAAAAAAFGINLNGPRPTPPVIRHMEEYDTFRPRESFVDGWFADEQRSPSPGPLPRFPFSPPSRQQLREETRARGFWTGQDGEGQGGAQ